MTRPLPVASFLEDDRWNAAAAWTLTTALVGTTLWTTAEGELVLAAVAATAAVVAVAPPIVHRSWTRTVPWPLLLVASLPLVVGAFGRSLFGDAVFAVGIVALSVLVAVALQLTTAVRMTPNFALGFVLITTLGTAGLWTLGSAASARYLGTWFVASNRELMFVFTTALVASVGAALVFRWYVAGRFQPIGDRATDRGSTTDTDGGADTAADADPALELAEVLSPRRQGQLVRVLQAVMVGIVGVGVVTGDPAIVVNAGFGLAVTFLPAYLERNYRFKMSVGTALFLTAAMFLHALGVVPLPVYDFASPYRASSWWDHLTHVLSSAVVAGVAYATVRALDEHTRFVRLPQAFLVVFLVLFVSAFGVLWEVIEFYLGEVATSVTGDEMVLIQYGLEDTVLDLFYNTLGAVAVTAFGRRRLAGLADELTDQMDGETGSERGSDAGSKSSE